jgi:putative cell wall-binding protein
MTLTTNRFKWLSVALATAVATTLLALPGPAAAQAGGKINLEDEILNARKQKVIRQLEQYEDSLKAHRTAPRNTSKMSTQAATSAVFKGKVSVYEAHFYWLEVSGSGTVNVSAGQPEDIAGYAIVNPETGEEFVNGDQLAPGSYMFVVFGQGETPADYSFTVSGVSFTYDNTLPNLNVTKPASHESRLAQGTTQVTFAGSHDGDDAELYTEDGMQQLPKSFSVNVPVRVGYNFADLVAHEASGNMVAKSYFITVPGTKRIAGANRYEVSAKISQEMFPEDFGGTVIIARGDLYTDALSGGSLAGLELAPILLSDYKTQSLPTPIQNEIKRLNPTKAIILGGTGSVSTNVENQLKSLGVTTIERIAGANRFDVSAKIGHRVLSSMGGAKSGVDTAIVASGLVFPDALSASSPSGMYSLPILQVTKDALPTEIDAFIKNHPYIKNFIIVGGPGTVSDTVKVKLQNYANDRGGLVDRIGGANRYEVSVNVAKYEPFQLFPFTHVFAKGTDFPDALSGGPLAAFNGGPILLTPTTKVDPSVQTYLNNTQGKDFYYILGGTGSITTEVENQLKATLQ